MNHAKSICLILSFLFVASFIHAQISDDNNNSEESPFRSIGEFAISNQIEPLYERNSGFDFSLNLGMQERIKGNFSIGVHLFSNLLLGGDNTELQTGIRPRFAYKLGYDLETSFSPGIILTSSLKGLNKFKGLSFESNIYWQNKIGLALRFDRYFSSINGNDTVVNLGIQTHATTAFYSFSGIAVGGGILILVLKGLLGG